MLLLNWSTESFQLHSSENWSWIDFNLYRQVIAPWLLSGNTSRSSPAWEWSWCTARRSTRRAELGACGTSSVPGTILVRSVNLNCNCTVLYTVYCILFIGYCTRWPDVFSVIAADYQMSQTTQMLGLSVCYWFEVFYADPSWGDHFYEDATADADDCHCCICDKSHSPDVDPHPNLCWASLSPFLSDIIIIYYIEFRIGPCLYSNQASSFELRTSNHWLQRYRYDMIYYIIISNLNINYKTFRFWHGSWLTDRHDYFFFLLFILVVCSLQYAFNIHQISFVLLWYFITINISQKLF